MRSRLSILLFASLLTTFSGLFFISSASAAFNQNDIIDDSIFDNANTMSASDINAFLNSFPNSCISPNNHFLAADPTGYNPSGGFQYGSNVTAGQVIYDAAQAYSINPQVLITTLQKEEGLVKGDGPYGCSALALSASVGYGCPDARNPDGSIITYTYSGLNPALYITNGAPVTSVSGTCVNSASKAGFSQQLIRAAWLFKFGEQRSEGNVGWAVIKGSWDNSDDPPTTYTGIMTQGCHQRSQTDTNYPCPPGSTYDGYTTIDGTAVHLDSGATAAMYTYTPHFNGNRNFVSIFETYFGSTTGCPQIDSNWVYQLYQPQTGDYLYTQNASEICQAQRYYGYTVEGQVIQTLGAADPTARSVYRLSRGGTHLYTIDPAERDAAMNSYGYTYEGVAYYVSVSAAANYYPVYRLSKNSTFFYTTSAYERDEAINDLGYSYQSIAYYAPSPSTKVTMYRLSKNGVHLYTTSVIEKTIALAQNGYVDEGRAFYVQSNQTGDDLMAFREVRNGRYFLTSSFGERALARQTNYSEEASYAYVYPANYPGTVPVYRLSNAKTGDYLYTTDPYERNLAQQQYGYVYEGIGFDGAP